MQQSFPFHCGGASTPLLEGAPDQRHGRCVILCPVLIPFGQFDQGEPARFAAGHQLNLAEIEKKYSKNKEAGRETRAWQEWVQRVALKKLDPDEKMSQEYNNMSSI
ncbi:MAG: hypothetical protein Q7I89_00430 [Syntrophales bacterium]|nr:hypothetical protein [Syntrophales bacterium]